MDESTTYSREAQTPSTEGTGRGPRGLRRYGDREGLFSHSRADPRRIVLMGSAGMSTKDKVVVTIPERNACSAAA
jgi:hypothetical protein